MIAVLIAGAVSMLLSLFGTRRLIAFFDNLGKGQPILGSEDHGPVHHMKKQGTATMGGLAILFSAFTGWMVAHLRDGIAFSDQAMIMWAGVAILATMGFLDDFLKVRKSHNRGIFWKKKGWITFGLVLIVMYWLSAGTGVRETLSFTRFDLPGWELHQAVWVVWTAIMVWSTTNAVNVTDGLDGLAAGSALFGFLAFTVIAYWAFRNPDVYRLVNPAWSQATGLAPEAVLDLCHLPQERRTQVLARVRACGCGCWRVRAAGGDPTAVDESAAAAAAGAS